MSETNLITEAMKAKIREALSDIGKCVNGTAIAYTPKRSVYAPMVITVPSPGLDRDHFEEFSVAMICEMVRAINCFCFLPSPEDKGQTRQIVFRWLSIVQKEDNYEYYVRCAIESASSPDTIDMSDEPIVNQI